MPYSPRPRARSALTAFVVAAAACAPRTPDPAATAATVTQLADAYWKAWLARNPEFGTLENIPGTAQDRLEDNSLAALAGWHRQEDDWWSEVEKIDAAIISGRSEAVTLAYLTEALDASRQERVCRSELWRINQIVGWHLGLTVIAQYQPVGDSAAREAALARWRSVGPYVDTEIANLREGLRLGYRAARQPVERVIGELNGMIPDDPTHSPFYGPAARDSDATFRSAFRTVIGDVVTPALTRYRDFLKTEYLPAAREAPGVSANPDGAACYRARVRQFTTVDIDPQSLYEMGMREVEKLKAERARLVAQDGTADVRAFLAREERMPENRFTSRDDIVRYSEGVIAHARDVSRQWFHLVPEANVVVQPFPTFQEQSAPGGQYYPGPADGSRPGVYLINAANPTTKSKIGLEDLAYHEAIPGHHFQLSLANERRDAHPITKYVVNSGFAEGWALYAELLADEMGLYSSDAQRVAMLNSELGRAARMVADPAVHVLGWSRERVVQFMADLLGDAFGAPASAFGSEADRYIAWPGQAPSYTLGMLEIMELRSKAQRALGPRFDIETFHDRVLEDGAVPLPYLRAKLDAWITSPNEPARQQ